VYESESRYLYRAWMSPYFFVFFHTLFFGFSVVFFWIVFSVVACRRCYRPISKTERKEDEERKERITSPPIPPPPLDYLLE
jgi:hypothetical protein